jgi:hypothetical protein
MIDINLHPGELLHLDRQHAWHPYSSIPRACRRSQWSPQAARGSASLMAAS